MRSPINDEESSRPARDRQLLSHLALNSLRRALAWLNVAARNIPAVLVRRAHHDDPALSIANQQTSCDARLCHGRSLRVAHVSDCRPSGDAQTSREGVELRATGARAS